MKIKFRALAPMAALVLTTLSLALPASADVNVLTLGGGRKVKYSNPDYGNAQGNTFTQAQWNTPYATALDSSGNMFLADQLNNQICKITQLGNTSTSTNTDYITGLNAPTGVVVDGSDNLYVLTSDNYIRKYNLYKNGLATNWLGNVSGPSAMALAPNGTSLYVSYTSGTILEAYQNGTTRTVLTGIGTMRGIGVLPSGEIVVSIENGNPFSQAIVICATNNPNPAAPTMRVLSGNNGQGFTDGTNTFAQFYGPCGLATTVDGKVVVADRYNHRVRVVQANGTTTTLYGVDPTNWTGLFPGWADGNSTTAAAREPLSVTISTNGYVFTTEYGYHLLREVTGTGLTTGQTGGTTGTNVAPITVPAPSFSPNAGYYPQCQTITVTTGGGNVYYTTDGTEPTTNSTYVPTPNNTGSFTWCNSTNSLVALKMKCFIGTNSSLTVSGQASSQNQVGFTKDVVAGIGSTAVVPIVINMQSNGVLKSLQFRVEVTPGNGAPDMIPDLQVLTITTNDFVPLVGPGQGTVTFQTFPYTTASNGRGLVISALGGSSGFDVKNFAVVAMLAIPIPATCAEGQNYQLSILFPSGTSDGVQADVPMYSLPPRTLTIQNVQYLVGDSSPGRWYGAGEFGDSTLANADVNNALYASVGIRVPYPFTDAFDSMDAFPETPGGQMGDGFITFLDWQHILKRSLGIETNNWLRSWSSGGVRSHQSTTLVLTPHIRTSPATATPPGTVWVREAVIGAGTANTQLPGTTCSIPVYVKVGAGYSLAGLQFRATLDPEGSAPMPGAITFSPAAGITGGQVLPGTSPNDIVCFWSIGALATSLHGSNLLGQINFTVPGNAYGGSHYTLHFPNVDGAPDMDTFYQLESSPGSAWVMANSTNTPTYTSYEWKTNFFGSTTNSLALDNADPDGDGVPNWKEYLAGTDPNSAASCLHFNSAVSATGATTLTWLSAPGKSYAIEAAPSITSTTWTVIGTVVGDGNVQQVTEPNSGTAQFYRIRLQP
jgi:hypothetical protein